MSQIHGMFPGGPTRQSDSSQNGDRTEPSLRPGEDVEAGIVVGRHELKERRRRRSMVIAIAVALVVGGVGGVYVGLQALVTPEELTEQLRTEDDVSELDGIVNDVMKELWRMEDIEAARNRR